MLGNGYNKITKSVALYNMLGNAYCKMYAFFLSVQLKRNL